jgi:sugar lactone lactonase YvrE
MSLNVAYKLKCLLGESPVWNCEDDCIYFIDIKKPAINRFSTRNLILETIDAPSEIGCIVLNRTGGLVAAMKGGLAFVDFENAKYNFFASIDDNCYDNRPNDGKCDIAGRLWIASMDMKEREPSGKLWSISSSATPKIMDKNFIVGNGIDWSLDSKKMYFTDSINRTIYIYDFDSSSGSINNKKVFVKISALDGYPDGLTVDSQGFIWSAHWDGWRLTRYTPDGLIDKIISLPVPRPTSMTFGSSNFSKLYITSASYGLTSDELERAPLSGSLFVYDSSVPGKACNIFSTL